MLLTRKIKKYVVVKIKGCDVCQTPIRKQQFRITRMILGKGIHNRRQWETRGSMVVCPGCWKNVSPTIIKRVEEDGK
jgi:hypothetical protein